VKRVALFTLLALAFVALTMSLLDYSSELRTGGAHGIPDLVFVASSTLSLASEVVAVVFLLKRIHNGPGLWAFLAVTPLRTLLFALICGLLLILLALLNLGFLWLIGMAHYPSWGPVGGP